MQEAIKNAPLLPGCYIYHDKDKDILYVGKAKMLRNRVKSYFSNFNRVEEKIRQMIEQASSIEFLVTDSEIEALILESILIKKYKPKYNTMLMDDKKYVYVAFDKVKKSPRTNVPTVHVVRDKDDNTKEYFGPYPDSRAIKRLLRRLRRVFPYPSRNEKVSIPARKDQLIKSHESKPSFHSQIGLSPDFHSGLITRGEYENNLSSIKKIFAGEKNKLAQELEKQMQQAAKDRRFEQAARYRNMLHDIKYAGSNLRIDTDADEVAIMQAKRERREEAQNELVTNLSFPPEILKSHLHFRIECYDISNFQGKSAVGSMVVFINGQPSPDMYRRFKIRMPDEPNDFGMLQEVLTRRFNQYLTSHATEEDLAYIIPKSLRQRLKNWKPDPSFSQMPDLIIIDGGKGQLSATYKILQQYNLAAKIPIVGLAKREEEIFKMKTQFAATLEAEDSWHNMTLHDQLVHPESDFERVRLPRKSESLYLVQRIRDEAHRFAINYHRQLRSKALQK
jgi:excinuclease ABC subunit C